MIRTPFKQITELLSKINFSWIDAKYKKLNPVQALILFFLCFIIIKITMKASFFMLASVFICYLGLRAFTNEIT